MAAPMRRPRVSLETKVMVAVLAVLIALPVTMLWILDRRLQELLRRDADLALSTARGSFEQALRVRSNELTVRFRSQLSEPRLMQIVRLNDAATLSDHFKREMLEVFLDDTEIVLFFNRDAELFARARREATRPVDGFAAAVTPQVRAALQESESTAVVAADGKVFHAVALPIRLPEIGLAGVLVFGTRLSDAALRDIQPPSTEILVTAGNTVAASTLQIPSEAPAILAQLTAAQGEEHVRIGGDRFKPAAGTFARIGGTESGQYYVLASSEQQLAALEQTRVTLVSLSAAGVLIAAGVVWFLVRRITHPLVTLRNTAEAVGRGDFSRRIESISNDECGELAEAFNQMTSSLQSSRSELERAMQQLRATQEQLIQSEKLSAVGQFVAGVAHELNNPLTAVVGFSELLQGTETDEKTRGHLDRIAKSAHRCHKIVHSLLSFARQHPPERKLVDLHTAIDEVLEIMAYEFRTTNVTIVKEFAPALPAIMADAHQLQQVFVNILGNARQAIESVQKEGRIIVRTRHLEDRVLVDFQDNGPGIRAEHLARIFDPFFTTKPVGKGTGLGLSLCYGLVQEHGGLITARSEPGQGATFTIELPMAASDAVPSALRRSASASPFPPPRVQATGKRVLVIDDEHWIRDLAGELLREEGYEVETAARGEEAIEILRQRKFDVIVCDWKMPGLNGIRLYEHLQATDPAAARRVVFMTGDVVADTFQAFLQEHSIDCLAKPFAAREFRAAVARVFAQAK